MSRRRSKKPGAGSRHILALVAAALATAAAARSDGAARYADHRLKVAEAQAARTRAGQEIGAPPDRASPERYEACRTSLRRFCETYLPGVFYLPWSDDHLKAIARLESAVLHGGLFAFAMPRKGGKTALLEAAVLWAVLYGHQQYAALLAVLAERGEELVNDLKSVISGNTVLWEDFGPELHALRALEGEPRRCIGQRCMGQPTHVRWQRHRIVFGQTPGSRAAGAVISATGLTGGGVRGQRYTPPAGDRVVRPGFVGVDDPQDDEIAYSPTQVRSRVRLLQGAVLGMAGHGKPLAAVATVTVIQPDDVASALLDRKRFPDWRGERLPILYGEKDDPKLWGKNPALWEEYRRLREEDLRTDGHAATDFYRARQKEMDSGLRAAWPAQMDEGEISAIQHAMNLRFRDEQAFWAEYQNDPRPETAGTEVRLTVQQVMDRASGRPRGEVPLAVKSLTAFIDVHNELLYWTVCGWEENFTGHLVDYGTWPEQAIRNFTLRDAGRTLSQKYPGRDVDGAILAGLEALIPALLAKTWPRAGGAGVARIERLLVDTGHKPHVVAAAKYKIGGATMVLSRGVGITADRKPISAYKKKPGETHGHEWYFPSVTGTQEFAHVAYDTNYWKTRVARALAVPPGDPGALTLFGKMPEEHRLLAEHLAASETWTEMEAKFKGRTIHQWRERPGRDNHWWDCLVGCAVGASMAGVKTAGEEAAPPRKRRRWTQADFDRLQGKRR